MWKYHEDYNYYDCFLGKHRVVVQPLYTCYSVRLYLGEKEYVEIKKYVQADNIEEAQNLAMRIVFNYARDNASFWNVIASDASEILNSLK